MLPRIACENSSWIGNSSPKPSFLLTPGRTFRRSKSRQTNKLRMAGHLAKVTCVPLTTDSDSGLLLLSCASQRRNYWRPPSRRFLRSRERLFHLGFTSLPSRCHSCPCIDRRQLIL